MTLANRGPLSQREKGPMKVVLVAGEPVFRLGFRALLQTAPDLILVGEASDARASFALIDAQQPDVVIMDVALPGMSGTSATRELSRRVPAARILLMAAWPRERDVLEGLAAGASGFALKSEPAETLLYAIRMVGQGQGYLTPEARGMVSANPHAATRRKVPVVPGDVLGVLSAREREVLDLVVRGWANRDMARELCVSIKTIDTHRTRINRKLQCRSAADLIRFAADNGLLRRAPSAGQTPAVATRTVVMLIPEAPGVLAELLQDLIKQGYEQTRAPSVALAMAELSEAPKASLLVVEPSGGTVPIAELYRQVMRGTTSDAEPVMVLAFDEATAAQPGVRAVAALPNPEASERFLAALDRAVSRLHEPRGGGRIQAA
jgi:two-component system response regulator NreC